MSLWSTLRRAIGLPPPRLRASTDPWLQRAGIGPVYDAADRGRRTRDWVAPSYAANTAIAASADILRQRSHALMRSNPWAFNGLETFVANLVGTGITPRAQYADVAFRTAAHQRWLDWTDEADASGTTDFYGLQALVGRALFEGGECFVRVRPRRAEDGLVVPLQLQVLEAEHVPLAKTEALPGGSIRHGIEFDALGRRVAYWMYREHPGEATSSLRGGELVRVPADQVLHVYRPLRPGQVRGEPWLARVLLRLHELDQYEDAELVRKKIAAMFAIFVRTPTPDAPPILGEHSDDDTTDQAGEVHAEPGSTVYLQPGEDIATAAAADVGPNFEAFHEQVLRAIAAGVGVTYEMLTGDLSRVNYSSIRAGTLEFRRRCEALIHQVLVFQFCRPVWQRWMDAAVLSGALAAPDYARRRREYQRAVWVPPGWQWVDPLKEVTAKVAEIRAGLTSRNRAVAERGEDVASIDQEIAADAARAEDLGLVFDTDARRSPAAVAAEAMEPASDTGDAPPPARGRSRGGRA